MADLPPLTPDERRRYGRHLRLPGVGEAGQRRLKGASVLLVGVGGLGAPLALYLAAAGVGRLGLVDDDRVDASNLHRQVLFGEADVGCLKVEAAAARLGALNPFVDVVPYAVRLTPANAEAIVAGYDVVADGSDNFPTRYLVNDVCVRLGLPHVHGSLFRFEGQVGVFGHGGGPCYRCLYPAPPAPGLLEACDAAGVLGVLPGMVGTLQANEVLKLLLGLGTPLAGRLLLVDALGPAFTPVAVPRDPACPACGSGPRPAPPPAPAPALSAEAFVARRRAGTLGLLLDVRRPEEHAAGHLGGHLLPLDELPRRLDELAPHRDAEVVVYCQTGARSARAVHLLRAAGFAHAVHVAGGLVAVRAAAG